MKCKFQHDFSSNIFEHSHKVDCQSLIGSVNDVSTVMEICFCFLGPAIRQLVSIVPAQFTFNFFR